MLMMLRQLTKHFLATPETITYAQDGTWSHNKKKVVSFPAYVHNWAQRKFGSSDVGLVLSDMDKALTALGPGSEARFTPVVDNGLDAVQLEFLVNGVSKYRSNVYYADEDPEWFGISVRIACSLSVNPSRGVRPKYECS